jgi:hypothetical protein
VVSHYDVLGVEPTADVDEIRHAWRVKVRLLHPDLHRGSPADVQAEAASETSRVNRAWETLRDPDLRRRYDEALGDRDPVSAVRGRRRARTDAAIEPVTVTCTICETTQHVPRTAGRFDCENCKVAWQFAKCESCNAIEPVRERKTHWRCTSCGRDQPSTWRGGSRYVYCTRCKAGTLVAPDLEHFNCVQCRLGHVRCPCAQYSPVLAWQWRSWRCPKCRRLNPPGRHASFDVAQVLVMVVAICLVMVGVTLLAGMAR